MGNPSSTPPPVTEGMIEAGADAYHEAVAAALKARRERNDSYEAAGRERLAQEDVSFPIDWLVPVYRAMHAARSNQDATPRNYLAEDCDELDRRAVQEATRTVGDGETELDANGEAMVCEGCGTTRTIAAILERHGPKAIACCPERKMVEARYFWRQASAKPDPEAVTIPMLLYCPNCGLQHIDAPDDLTPDWTNPPHKSHLCHGCGCIWRPADVPTNGVAVIETRGKADTWSLNMLAKPVQEATRTVGDGEPVAWRWRYMYQGKPGRWTLRSTPLEPHPETPDLAALEVEPLYAAKPDPEAVTRMVEALRQCARLARMEPETNLLANAIIETVTNALLTKATRPEEPC